MENSVAERLLQKAVRDTQRVAACSTDFALGPVKRLIRDYTQAECLSACSVYLNFYFRFFADDFFKPHHVGILCQFIWDCQEHIDAGWGDALLFENTALPRDARNLLKECHRDVLRRVVNGRITEVDLCIVAPSADGCATQWSIRCRGTSEMLASGVSSSSGWARIDATQYVRSYSSMFDEACVVVVVGDDGDCCADADSALLADGERDD